MSRLCTAHILILLCGILPARGISAHADATRKPLSLAGSNYFFYDLGAFGTRFNHPPDKPWASASNINTWNDCWYSFNQYAPDQGPQLVIQNLHKPDVLELVRAQLAQMRAEGQSAIAIPIWFANVAPNIISDHAGHMFDWHGLTDQQKTNLLALTHEIYAAGFLKITFRFNCNGDADPGRWNNWQPDSFQKCSHFVVETIALLRQSLMARFGSYENQWSFDLGGELGGSALGQASAYTAQLMKAYIDTGFSIHETCGFSMACGDRNISRVFQNQLNTLSALGPAYVPQSWAVTCYSRSALKTNIQEGLASLAQAMRQYGRQNQPVIIMECLNNDAAEAAEINSALDFNPGLNITELYQWPISRAALDNGVWTVDSACAQGFDNYRNIGRSTSPGTFSFEQAAITTTENGSPGGQVTLKVLRTGGAVSQVTIPYLTANGTATAGQDYLASTGSVTFSEGQSSATISIMVLNDRLVESPETFHVNLGSPSAPAAGLGAIASATITIISDEAPPPPSRPISAQAIIAKGSFTGLKINFSYDLHPNSTTSLNSYRLYGPGKDSLFNTPDDVALPLVKVAYDRTHNAVTLNCKPCKLSGPLRLGISGTGARSLLDNYNRPIDGDRDSNPGGDALLIIHRDGSIRF